MSAFGGKADMERPLRNVCFVPKADIAFTLNWRQVGILFYGGTTRFEACFSGIATT